LGPNESVTVGPDFSLGDTRLISVGDLAANDPFISDNLRRDGIPVVSPTTTTTTTTTPSETPAQSTSAPSPGAASAGTARSQALGTRLVRNGVVVRQALPASPVAQAVPANPAVPPSGGPVSSPTAPGRITFSSNRA